MIHRGHLVPYVMYAAGEKRQISRKKRRLVRLTYWYIIKKLEISLIKTQNSGICISNAMNSDNVLADRCYNATVECTGRTVALLCSSEPSVNPNR